MKTAVVSREDLKEAVNQALALPSVKSGDLFIAGVTKASDNDSSNQMILEIVQSKKQVTNIENSKFKPNIRALRVWYKITPEGFDHLFHSLTIKTKGTELTGAELQEKTATLKVNEILAIFTKIKSITIDGEEEVPTISIKQYSAERGLPKRIQAILDTEEDERTEGQIADLKSMSLVTIDGQEVPVDEYGNQVYEINEFTYGEDEDVFIKKMSIDKYYNYVFNMKGTHSNQFQSEICKPLSSNELILWTSELIEKYEDKWDWNELNKNASIPWTLKLINKYADKLSCSESIWKTLKPYIDDKLIEEVFKEINKS